jgi:hypothetical protein
MTGEMSVYGYTETDAYNDAPDAQFNSVSAGSMRINDQAYLHALCNVRLGRECRLDGADETSLILTPAHVSFRYRSLYGPPPPDAIPLSSRESDFLFLDSLSAIEDGYLRKKDPRAISLTLVERRLLNITTDNPALLHSYNPRLFEYLVASLLTALGFSRVRLSRHWQDDGRDIWAVYCEGDNEHTVVVEVKHYSRRQVGIAIVDRLNGVRDRLGATRGIVATNSSFSKQSRAAYTTKSQTIALLDFERLVALLGASGTWHGTPSGLWSANHHLPAVDAGRR